MTSDSRFYYTAKNNFVPLVLFPTISAIALTTLIGGVNRSQAPAQLTKDCVANGTDIPRYLLKYTGFSTPDSLLCRVISFFHIAMDPEALPTTAYVLASLSPLALFPFVEASRNRKPFIIAFPVLLGVAYQTLTIAAVMPLFCAAFIMSGAAELHKRNGGQHTIIDHGHAESLLFGLIVGYVIPSVGMLVLQDPMVTAIWQAWPIWFSLAHLAHRLARPNKMDDGYLTVLASYIGCFVVASSAHFCVLWRNWESFKTVILYENPHTTTVPQFVANFLKWDAGFAFVSLMIATLWFAEDVLGTFRYVVWYVFSVPLIGPGASVTAVLLNREAKLKQQRSAALIEKAK